MSKTVFGVGINDADYVVSILETVGHKPCGKRIQRLKWKCPFYRTWQNMLKRCYSEYTLEIQPTYKGCTVCDDWKSFSKFKAWMETQDWEGKSLDKDLLLPGNRVYSPDTCVFVTQRVNTFCGDCKKVRGDYPVGVCKVLGGKYKAQVKDGNGKTKFLGNFSTPEEAHQAWLKAKLELAKRLAAEQADPRVAKALVDRYENYTEDI